MNKKEGMSVKTTKIKPIFNMEIVFLFPIEKQKSERNTLS